MQLNESQPLRESAKIERHPIVTLLGVRLANPGCEFIQGAACEECQKCRMVSFCYNLPVGRRFRVRGVRNTEHQCMIHADGKVRAVEVEPVEFDAAIDQRFAISGSTLTFDFPACGVLDCPNFHLCYFHESLRGLKFIVEEVSADVVCPLGQKRKRVRLTYSL